MFATRYLERSQGTALVSVPPDPHLGIVVVIPCKDEPEVLKTLNSLNQCQLPEQSTEILIVINHAESASEEVKKQNTATRIALDQWGSGIRQKRIRYYPIGPLELKNKWAGAGLARKNGMDEAIRRFQEVNKPEGIIVSLDADTLVDPNYLTAVEDHFRSHPSHIGATITFSHQREGLTDKHRQGIDLYETYMDYYKKALSYTGYPYPMFTVGSAFAVIADAYVKRGGMNRRQAGEDFYFLQNLTHLGTVGEIDSTTVHPSARLSNRVPFGTGPRLNRWMLGEEDLSTTYNLNAFKDLKQLFDQKDKLYQIEESSFIELVKHLPRPVARFLQKDNFWKDICELNTNCATINAFEKRFFHKFSAFKVLKFLNFSHLSHYPKAPLHEQTRLLSVLQEDPNDFYRSISKFYSEIFPFNPAQLQFVKRYSDPLREKTILDIGCATGELSFQLAQEGAGVTGIDLNSDLISQAQSRKTLQNLQFRVGDMLEVSNYFPKNNFDTALCFGNTLVHLSTPESMLQMMQGVYQTLKTGGFFLLQILNYDYILSEKISELPLIESDNIKFIRKYDITKESPVIRFKTELLLKNSQDSIKNNTPLYALQSNDLTDLLHRAGFTEVQLFSNFMEAPFGGKHIPLVVKAKK